MKKALLPLALLALSQASIAQQPPAGGQLLPAPALPALPRPPPEIKVQPRTAPVVPLADGIRISVQTLRIEGAQAFSSNDLVGIAGFTPGRELTLTDLETMATRITAHYRRNGYFVAQAYLPAQEVANATVTLAVNEGRYGKVEVRNQAGLSDSVLRSPLQGLDAGDPITVAPLESRLLLLTDVPGINVKSTLVPGASAGTSDLLVDVTPGQRVSGSIDVDNAGNRYTGAWRAGATVNFNEPLGLGDVASLRVLSSGQGLKYARGSYQLQAGRGQVGVAYSRLDYRLGREFSGLQAHGTAGIASVFGRYPLLRSRDNNIYVQLALDSKRFRDDVDSIPARTKRKSRVLMSSLYGDHRDSFGGGGLNSHFLTWASGRLDIETPEARANDAVTAQTQGRFDKLSLQAMRIQRIGTSPFSLSAGITGQLARKNLDVSEKMELGGMNGVRAYPEGEAYADQGYLATFEGRMDLPGFSPTLPGQMQLVAFIDTGRVTLARQPWTGGVNYRALHGAGFGLNWVVPSNFLIRAYYARKLGNTPATSAPDRTGRFWFQAVKFI